MIRVLFTLFFISLLGITAGQTAWGTLSPDNSAALDIYSGNKGVLFPRMPTAVRNSISAAQGLLVFDTDTNTYWYYSGSTWVELVYNFEKGTVGMIAAFATGSIPANWRALNGSSIPAANFPELAARYPGWVSGANIILPDYRGYFLRGAGTNVNGVVGGTLGQKQADATARPTTAFATNSAGNNAHTGTITNSAGSHSHSFRDLGGGSNNVAESALANNISDDLGASRTTSTSANHSHTIQSISSAGAHTHTITGGGDAETRPRNISVVWAVKVLQ